MSNKTKYSLLTALVVILTYGAKEYINVQEQTEVVAQGKTVKSDTNEYFLPTSTTGQIVHHDGYSLSYSEHMSKQSG